MHLLEVVAKLRFCRFSISFEPILPSFLGVIINIRILTPKKEGKIGQNNPENRRLLSFATTSLVMIMIAVVSTTHSWCEEKKQKPLAPSHFMVGPGVFDVDRDHPAALVQVEYRWEVNCYHIRPLAAFFITTDQNFFVCGGIGFDIFIGRKIVFTPSFAPGLYYSGYGKHLGFPLNFRSAAELSYVFHNQGRFGAQFNHISNARILWKNPGANSLVFFYAIPFPQKNNTNRKKQ